MAHKINNTQPHTSCMRTSYTVGRYDTYHSETTMAGRQITYDKLSRMLNILLSNCNK